MILKLKGSQALAHTANRGEWFEPRAIEVFRSSSTGRIALHVHGPKSIPICLSLALRDAEAIAKAILSEERRKS